jgi:hypothetical protein
MATFLLLAWLGLIAFLIWVNACGRPVRDGLDAEGLSESSE